MKNSVSYLFPFERSFVVSTHLTWMQDNWHLAFFCTGFYVISAIGLQRWMRTRRAWDLRRELVIWNGCMALFSAVATWRILPTMIEFLFSHGLLYTVCAEELIPHPLASGFWMWAYVISKVVELGDTAFIVLRKRPLTFLHVFHHTLTMISAWYGFAHRCGIGRWFVTINFFVHSIMYFYYMLKILGIYIPKIVSISITALQITQMFLGFYIALKTFLHVVQPNVSCTTNLTGCLICTFMYIAYIFLFCQFFYSTYISARRKNRDIKSD